MGLRDIGGTLPPGFRFYPSDEELICHYLYKKIANEEVVRGTLMEIDLHTCEPWQLPDSTKLNSSEWYFFSFRDRKYASGYRTNRATTSGYWKATGKDRTVVHPMTRAVVGMRKTLVFYKNRAPNGIKTGWIMHEFRLENPHVPPKEDWVLCRVFYKSRCENSTQNVYNNDHLNTLSCANLDGGFQNTIASFFSNGPSLQNPSTSGPGHFLDHQLSQYNIDSINEPDRDPSTSTPRREDDYGFLFDMNFVDDSSGGIMSHRCIAGHHSS